MPKGKEDLNQGDIKKVELTGALEGHYVLVDMDRVTYGFVEDMALGVNMVNSLLEVIVGGDMPYGFDREGLRKLNIGQFKRLSVDIVNSVEIPKVF